MDSVSNTVLITGAGGFTGRHLADHLTVLGYCVIGTTVGKDSGDFIHMDLSDPDEVMQVIDQTAPDYVIHLAGISFTEHGQAEDFYRINLLGTLNLLNVLVKTKKRPHRVVLASSAAVYGPREGVLHEDLCPAPVSHYGTSKLAMEYMSATYRDSLDVINVRPFNYTGPGQPEHFVIPKIVAAYSNDQDEVRLGNIDVVREFNDVRMVTDIYARLLKAEKCQKVINLCSGKGHRLQDVLTSMEEISGRPLKITTDQSFVRKNDIQNLTGSVDRLESCIGTLKRYSLRETLEWMFEKKKEGEENDTTGNN
ncbi:MAG: NAD-dependent epimerase/dehydratase family protein [Desulfobulbaceae bacterium]|nr:NAD-dependent epimerase/dehydratase family protein [Desulfobulbaceae bacterium]